MTAAGGTFTNAKQPEYTGENRCLPCTAVNVVIAGVASAVVGVTVGAAVSAVVGTVAGLALFGVCLLAVYLRGYLIPGTPALTKRYLPAWALELFGKKPTELGGRDERDDIDPEGVLTAIGALEECADGADLCLTDSFREEWNREIDDVDGADADREQLLRMLDIEDGEVTYEEFGDAFRANVDGRVVGKWESRAAFLADLGAANVLTRHHSDWRGLSLADRSQLLTGLRLFIDACPECGGVPEFGTETVASCCSTHEVAAVSCTDCGSRLFETRAV